LLGSLVTGCELNDNDRRSIPGKITNFSLCHHVQTDFRAQPASYPMDTDRKAAGA
jgi:hypothetical protein